VFRDTKAFERLSRFAVNAPIQRSVIFLGIAPQRESGFKPFYVCSHYGMESRGKQVGYLRGTTKYCYFPLYSMVRCRILCSFHSRTCSGVMPARFM
jgi:hypothetical protein